MKVLFDRSFEKSIDKIADVIIKKRVAKAIINMEDSASLEEIRNLKRLSGFEYYYRIRVGEYRIGMELIDHNTMRLIIIAHRKDIYRHFPRG